MKQHVLTYWAIYGSFGVLIIVALYLLIWAPIKGLPNPRALWQRRRLEKAPPAHQPNQRQKALYTYWGERV